MDPKKAFRFELGAEVMLNRSMERGSVIGRSEYVNACDSYLVRYVTSDGRQVENWISEDALISTD
ncbi:hypothetical protein [Pleomorphomonas oryzae]|uniref:hypothetical protein n=1 Tax=Pleomorphomonas oryzae TaxID=261934 RepID=UPI0003FAFCB4|nr:hypothetical protein [Pleomorphomonas oryzae]